MVYVRAFIYGFLFFGALFFVAVHAPPPEQPIDFDLLKSCAMFGTLGGASFLASYVAAKVIYGFYTDLLGGSDG